MCTKEEVHEEVEQAIDQVKPSPLLKTVAGVWLIGASAIIGWNGITNFTQTAMLERIAYATEAHKEQKVAIEIIKEEIDTLTTWQKVHSQFANDTTSYIDSRIEDLHKIAEHLNTMINTKAADRWTGTDAKQRIQHENYRFEQIEKRLQKLEDGD